VAIDWSTEPFARLYKRETDDDLLLSWEARAVWHEFLKKCDSSGHIATRRGVQGLAALIRIPLDVVERILQELIEDGRIRSIPATGFVAPNYVDANYVARSNGARQAAFRAKQRASSVSDGNGSHGASDSTSRDVTPSNGESHGVTSGNENCHTSHPIHTNQSLVVPTDDAGASKSRAKRRAGIPEDWKPRDEERQLARSLGLDCDREAAEFLSYWLGDGRPKSSWDQTFRNRLQQQSQRGGQRQGSFLNAPTKPRKLEKL
jgi:hypothetical protein